MPGLCKTLLVTFILLFLSFPCLCAQECPDNSSNNASDLTKTKCHPVRKEILDSLRSGVKSWSGLDVVFVVQFLKAKGSWAYAHVQPQSKDGKSKYEDVSALLSHEKGGWEILETRPCCGECEDDPDCADDRRYFNKLRKKFPSAPTDIFPSVE
ncbi:hypothetical protein [Desulforegula conservatrix]|uniref:hypothetical protein n=1 Tax=Desulforegula conservatrix TaxID=153026 RepID=UPI0006872232|nr:hypothetical protein [Desulforegula conservatrix]